MSLNPDGVRDMAQRYTEAWCSHSAEAVGLFYEEDGYIIINDGEPHLGRVGVTAMAQGFIDGFPDLVLHMDAVRAAGDRAILMWTLEGTNSEPDGSGHRVKVGGWEAWHLSDDLRVIASDGRFDAEEFDRQCAEGI